jgi:hypothetical protein
MGLNRRFNAGIKLPGAGSAAYGLRVSTRGKLEGIGEVLSKFEAPLAHSFIGYYNESGCEQLLHNPVSSA